MLATLAAKLPGGGDWTYEVKFDGYRTIAVKDGPRVTLFSRNLKDVTRMYASVAATIATIDAPAAMLDGEIVAIDAEGRPSFQALHHQAAHATVFYAFDLLHLNGRDLTRAPLDERRTALARLLEHTRVLRSEPLPGSPAAIEKAVRGLQLEGVVAKRGLSVYEPGRRSASWVKVKFNRRQEFVVGGYKPSGTSFESLVIGYYEGNRLHFAGRVRAGLTARDRAEISSLIAPLDTPRCPFVNLPTARTGHWGEGVTEADMAKLRWVKPRIVVDVSFVEWSRDGVLRHSQFVGLRTDKKPREVRRERAE
jgi:bifunctional non-homologous end joining protein LigD